MLLLKHRAFFIVVAASVVSLASAEQSCSQGHDDPVDPSIISTDTNLANAGPTELWRAGIYAGMNRNVFSADEISGLPEVPSCCPSYSSGGGFGAVIGWTFGLPLTGDWSTNWRIVYNNYGGELRTVELETVDAEHERVLATFEHTIEARVQGLSLEGLASFKAYRSLFVSAGFRGDYILEKWFYQREFLASPEGITYENGKRTRLEFEGEIPRANTLQAAVVGSVRYDLPLGASGDIVLSPEITAWYGLTDVVKDLPWGIHGIRFGTSLQFVWLSRPKVWEEWKEIKPIRSGPLVPSATEHPPTIGGESGKEGTEETEKVKEVNIGGEEEKKKE